MSQAPRLIDPITGSASNALNALSSLQQAAEANATQTNISEQQIAAGIARERMQHDLGVERGGVGEACRRGSETRSNAMMKQLVMAGREAQFRLRDRPAR